MKFDNPPGIAYLISIKHFKVSPQGSLFFWSDMILREPDMEDINFLQGLLHQFKDLKVVDLRRASKGKTLEISIHDPQTPITSDDCDRVSEILSNSEEFYARFGSDVSFQVASPGLERKLTSRRELELFAGRDVMVHYTLDGKPQERVGILLANSDQGKISFSVQGETIELDVTDVKQIRLYFDYDEDDE